MKFFDVYHGSVIENTTPTRTAQGEKRHWSLTTHHGDEDALLYFSTTIALLSNVTTSEKRIKRVIKSLARKQTAQCGNVSCSQKSQTRQLSIRRVNI